MKAKILAFFENFEEESISIEELSKILNLNKDDVANFLGDYKNYSNRNGENNCLSLYFNVCNEYYDNKGKKVKNNIAAYKIIENNYVAKATKVINRYYQDEKTKSNLYLVKLLTGETIYKGLVDNSDCGGLYTSAFTIRNSFNGREVSQYDKKNLEELFSLFPKESFMIKGNSKEITVSIDGYNISSTSSSFFVAFTNCIKELDKIYNFQVVQLFSIYDKEVSKDPYDYSPLCYSEQEAKDFIKNHKELGISYKIIQTGRK